ncbi:hypothetical protein [Stutzerimonas nitrititolerans]|uniref:hypothetical protein n=1 Tax=Stutzerimonas nitrititolerans TaxID=2482751 RepID=UPI0028A90A80|nr:hypothetical protein [Stutzerimonas nitrititolerans]
MADIKKLKEAAGHEALSERPARYITVDEWRQAHDAFIEESLPSTVLELVSEIEALRLEASSLRGSCKALGDENKHLARRARALHRAVTWFASTGWGVKRPVWLERILAKEVANG